MTSKTEGLSEAKEQAKDYRLRKRYKITLADYNRMRVQQDYKCAICQAPETNYKFGLVVDHCHASSYVRGLLCPYCNRKIVGNNAEDYFRVIGLIKYLQAQVKGDKAWKQITLKKRAASVKKRNR